jgi:hypothetical protein
MFPGPTLSADPSAAGLGQPRFKPAEFVGVLLPLLRPPRRLGGVPPGELAVPIPAPLRRRPDRLFTRPISGTLLALFVVVALLPAAQYLHRRGATEARRPVGQVAA